MKNVLKLEELSVEQKLGLATISFNWKASIKPENMEYLAELVKNRMLGGVWMTPLHGENAPYIKRLKSWRIIRSWYLPMQREVLASIPSVDTIRSA